MKEIVFKVKSIHELHSIIGFDKPKHPLISIIDYSKVKVANAPEKISFVCSFYCISFKKYCTFVYGRQSFDHQEGTLHCTAPDQIISFDRQKEEGSSEGWGLYFHPDLIRRSPLGKKIQEYSFFAYQENESLHLDENEKHTLLSLLSQMQKECDTNSDPYSEDLIISNLELFLNYCRRFYGRQFTTRSIHHRDVLSCFETYLVDYIKTNQLKEKGIPDVKTCAKEMHLSPNYFGDLIKSQSGKNPRDYIHYHILEQAKNLLAGSGKSIKEIALELGFAYPQNFSKLFKNKMGYSPNAYRNNNK